MKPFTSSIRRHLLSWLLLPIISLCFFGALFTYALALDFAKDAYDDALLDCAHSVANRLVYKSSVLTVDMPPAARAILKHGDKDNTYYQIIDETGKIISGDAYIPDFPEGIDLSSEPYFYDGSIQGLPVRCGAIEVPLPKNKKPVVIRVAETTAGRNDLTQSIFLGVLIPQLLLIVLSALAVWLGVARGLAPLGRLREAVERRNPTDLRPLSEKNVPKEVKPLVLSINKLLERLREDREAQKRFLSNAAHQLRTPLAGLKTQSELALRQKDPEQLHEYLSHIRTSANRAGRLAQQLLTLSRMEPAVFNQIAREPLDFTQLTREACSEMVSQAIAKGIDLGFESQGRTELVNGDRGSLYEMVINLVENAVFYTQAGGFVTVKVNSNEKGPCLMVEDNGPGIPEDQRELVFERFYRVLGNKETGSGLGLAIVREIAFAHEAQVELQAMPDGPGTLVTVQFKRLIDFSISDSAAAPNASLESRTPGTVQAGARVG